MRFFYVSALRRPSWCQNSSWTVVEASSSAVTESKILFLATQYARAERGLQACMRLFAAFGVP